MKVFLFYHPSPHGIFCCLVPAVRCARAGFEKPSSGEKKDTGKLRRVLPRQGAEGAEEAAKEIQEPSLCSGARRGERQKPARLSNFAHWSGMPGAKCRVKHLSKEMPGARRRMEEHGGLPPLPDRGSHGRPESPWSRSPNTCGSDRSSTPPPIDPYARSSPQPTTVEEPVAAPTRGEPTGWDKTPEVTRHVS